MSDSGYRLGYLAFVVWKYKVHTAAVYIELLTEVLLTHSRAFEVPAWETVAPLRVPTHYMLGRGFFPKCKIDTTTLLALSVEATSILYDIVYISAR